MITYLNGLLAAKKPTEAIVDIQGVGYRVLIPASSFQKLPEAGHMTRLFIHYYINNNTDTVALYGFATESERSVFERLISVSGIGPKMGLAVLSAMSPTELQEAMSSGDVGLLTKIPGVGKKTAERMIVELKDKFATLDLPATGSIPSASPEKTAARADALAALEALGLSRALAEKKLRVVLRAHPELISAQELIRLALRENG
ncbi:MAG TPA: Holliday junction branch migration protein RuvA [Bacteroidetes bacterium]|nr:Holliday junction branch migration protein RuvA [Bacteroidota bacterium]HRR08216.1 Holliday junction branch migration protein RuvA [Rhodothermales bacterium]